MGAGQSGLFGVEQRHAATELACIGDARRDADLQAGRAGSRTRRRDHRVIEIGASARGRPRGHVGAPMGGPLFAAVDQQGPNWIVLEELGLPMDFNWVGWSAGFGSHSSNDPLLPTTDPGSSADMAPEQFGDAFLNWSEMTLVAGGIGRPCPGPYCVITDPLDPITLGPDTPDTSIDVVLWPAQFQWLWVGAFTAGDFDENLVYEIEAQGSGGFSIDGEGASVSVDGSGLGLVRGFCVRARQTFANYPLLVHITRTPIGQNNGNLNLLLAGRLGYLPP